MVTHCLCRLFTPLCSKSKVAIFLAVSFFSHWPSTSLPKASSWSTKPTGQCADRPSTSRLKKLCKGSRRNPFCVFGFQFDRPPKILNLAARMPNAFSTHLQAKENSITFTTRAKQGKQIRGTSCLCAICLQSSLKYSSLKYTTKVVDTHSMPSCSSTRTVRPVDMPSALCS